jgi:hypothetical protein
LFWIFNNVDLTKQYTDDGYEMEELFINKLDADLRSFISYCHNWFINNLNAYGYLNTLMDSVLANNPPYI